MSDFSQFDDIDPTETREWLESIDSVLGQHGPDRAHFLLNQMIDFARRSGAYLPYRATTAYLNTIATGRQPEYPGDRSIERRIEAYIRWNAMAMVLQANKESTEFGGHISSYASSATLYEVGFNHFWRAENEQQGGDLIFMQGHSSPGIYARAYMEGRLGEGQLNRFRKEVGGGGLSSYPHPWLMPDFWQFPTVSMGLGPMMAIYQARFMRYLENREMIKPSDRKVWAFLGDGEMDEPESMGAITMPIREGLDNLIFVVNCNLQRLDGPVRGNGKIIQELESAFRGAGWNVIKVIWGSRWDPLLARDHTGKLRQLMAECVDGEYQNFKANGGDYTREHFFGKFEETAAMVANMSDDEIWHLNRGGHDPRKVYAAYDAAVKHEGQPTIILAKTVKGYGMGDAGEGQNIAHQQKKLDLEALKEFRDRFNIPVSDKDIENVPYCMPAADSLELEYLHEHRRKLGGYLPKRREKATALPVPPLETFKTQLEGTGEREASTTMAFVRILTSLIRDKNVGKNIVPIVPDEARTFGMEGMFRQVGIYASEGQLYTPQDADQLMYYREDKKGQILEEGINEAGAFCSWLASGTSYSNHNVQTVPFYIYYSMFGFQRIGDFVWAGGDLQSRGFLIGGTAGRTTLAGEGLQHQDGHSLVHASTVPNCVSYDPTYAYYGPSGPEKVSTEMGSLLAESKSNGQPKISQTTGAPTSKTIAGIDQLLLILPKKVPAALWRKLPQGSKLQSLSRRKAAGASATVSTHLNNKRQTTIHIARTAPGLETFESLTFARNLLASGLREKGGTLGIWVLGFEESEQKSIVTRVTAAALAAAHTLPHFKSKPSPGKFRRIRILGLKESIDLDRTVSEADGNNLARSLTALPANKLDAVSYVKLLKELSAEQGWQFKKYGVRELEKLGAGAFLAVAQGNDNDSAAIVRIQYRPAAKSAQPVLSLVGKGIIFDTGGSNLKPFTSMLDMHIDMGGSAVAIGSLLSISQMQLPIAVDCWLAITENRTGPNAYKSQDVVTAKNGKSIQTIHTDAEGRMALADALVMAGEENPGLIIDYATLTGACMNAVTTRYSGVFTNRSGLHPTLKRAGRDSGERVWPFPIGKEFLEELKSDTADLKQCSPNGGGDHILAASFLQEFVEQKIPWVHVDLSACMRKGGLGHVSTEITGFGVRYTMHLIIDENILDVARDAKDQ